MARINKQLSQDLVRRLNYEAVCKLYDVDPEVAAQDRKRFAVWDKRIAGFCVWFTHTGSKTYCLHYRPHGSKQVKRLTLGNAAKMDASLAREKAQEALAEIGKGSDPQGEKRAQTDAKTTDDVFAEWIGRSRKDGTPRAPKTRREYENQYSKFLAPAIGSKPIKEVTDHDCERIVSRALKGGVWADGTNHSRRKQGFQGKGNHTTQANRVRSLLSALLNYARKRKLIAVVPDLPEAAHEVKRTPQADAEGLAALGDALARFNDDNPLRPWVGAAIEALLVTGARVGEILTLQRGSIDTDNGVVWLSEWKGQTKANAEPKSLALTPELAAILEAAEEWRVPGNPHYFPARSGPGHFKGLSKAWDEFRTQYLNRPEMHLHDLRHLLGSVAVGEANVPLPLVGKMLGHTQTQTTERYARPALDPVKRAASQASSKMKELLKGGVA